MAKYRTRLLSNYTKATNRLRDTQEMLALVQRDLAEFRRQWIQRQDMESLPSAEWKFKAEYEQALSFDDEYQGRKWEEAELLRAELREKVAVDQALQALKTYRSEQYGGGA